MTAIIISSIILVYIIIGALSAGWYVGSSGSRHNSRGELPDTYIFVGVFWLVAVPAVLTYRYAVKRFDISI